MWFYWIDGAAWCWCHVYKTPASLTNMNAWMHVICRLITLKELKASKPMLCLTLTNKQPHAALLLLFITKAQTEIVSNSWKLAPIFYVKQSAHLHNTSENPAWTISVFIAALFISNQLENDQLLIPYLKYSILHQISSINTISNGQTSLITSFLKNELYSNKNEVNLYLNLIELTS